MNDTFFPKGYEVPNEGGRYTKFQDGENRFRILTSPVIGWEDWDDERNVFRFPMNKKPSRSRSVKKDARVKHFWAMVVWNYKTNQVEILSITQATIQNGIKALVDNPKWGKPFDYDIIVKRQGESLKTEYQVMPDPKSPIEKEIKTAFEKEKINLNALFTGDNPFQAEEANEDVNPDDVNL